MGFGLITLRRPAAVQPFRQDTCWDLYPHKERFQTHFKADKDCLDSSNDYIDIAQFCDIQFALSFDGVCLFVKKILFGLNIHLHGLLDAIMAQEIIFL